MNHADLAGMLELMAQALRLMPAGAARLPIMLGHKDIEMTELYLNDRGLSAKTWKRVALAPAEDSRG